MKVLDLPKSGKCGNTVWQRNRYCQYSYPAFTPRNPRSSGQCFVRKNFAIVSVSWRLRSEEQRQAWCHRAKSKQTRKRLGKRYPMRGYNYYMAVNVVLANRGQPLLDLPPAEPWQPPLGLPLLSGTLSPEELKRLTASLRTPPETPGPAPPASG